MMSNVAEGFDVWLAQCHGDVLRLCLALSLNRRAARELTFQAFLRLGACDAADDAQARRTVMTAAVDVCEAYYFRKMRRHPGAKALWEALDTPADDALLPLLRLPFRRRAAVCLRHGCGLSVADTAQALRIRPPRAERLSRLPDGLDMQVFAAMARPDVQEREELSDRVYLRFSERSVGFENRWHALRLRFDRMVPYIALFILALFLAAALYTASRTASG